MKSTKEEASTLETRAHPAVLQLAKILNQHLEKNPHLTLNGVSKRCRVSEPTLRRIVKSQIKTLPNATTALDILTYISRTDDISEIIKTYPGPIAEFLKESFSALIEEGSNTQYSSRLNEILSDPSKFLIYSLASGRRGVDEDTVKRLFGCSGVSKLEEMVLEKALFKKGEAFYAESGNISMDHRLFKSTFKATADFIKPEKLVAAQGNNVFGNLIESVNLNAYKELVKIQQKALRKCVQILNDSNSQGDIPVFVLGAVDTLSDLSVQELEEQQA
ncbi:MAG: hypothetical protein KDD22_01210 [Bdellovibrionales bacterium]|nr:hypothetical protein [Bdellovibrionales bacterium]